MLIWFESLSPPLQGLLATLFTYGFTALGAALVFFFKTVNNNAMDAMMGFAAGVMTAASFWSLLSPAVELAYELGANAWLTVTGGFLSGWIFVMLSEQLMDRISPDIKGDSSLKRSILLTSAVTVHNIPEGMAVGVAFGCAAMGIAGSTLLSAALLALGIALQNFPEGSCVAMPLRADGCSRLKSFLIGQASGMVEPIAGVIGVLFAMTMRSILPLTLSFSAGAMIAVVCSELIPQAFKDNKTVASYGVMMGFAVMMALDVALG